MTCTRRHAPTFPVELARVPGRERLVGPLQERVQLRVLPDGFELWRGRLLRALRGGGEVRRIPFSDITDVVAMPGDAAAVVVRDGAPIRGCRVEGEAAALALGAWWATGGHPGRPLVGASGAFTAPDGQVRYGHVVGGPAGIVFVPRGASPEARGPSVRVPMAHVRGLHATSPTRFLVVAELNGQLHFDARWRTTADLAAWFAGVVRDESAIEGASAGTSVVWEVDGRLVHLATLTVGEDGVQLAVLGGDVPDLVVDCGSVECIHADHAGADPRLVCRVGSEVHALRPIGPMSTLDELVGRLEAAAADRVGRLSV